MSQWVEQIVKERYKNASELAKAIGMTDSGFSRAIRKGTFDVENCLRLAHETETPAPMVLKLAGKDEIHALIETLYGKAASAEVISGAKTLRAFNVLSADLRAEFLRLFGTIGAAADADGDDHAPARARTPAREAQRATKRVSGGR